MALELESPTSSLKNISHQKMASLKKKKRQEAKCYRENKLLREKIKKLEKKQETYEKRLQRAKIQSADDKTLTLRSKTRKLLRNFSRKEV